MVEEQHIELRQLHFSDVYLHTTSNKSSLMSEKYYLGILLAVLSSFCFSLCSLFVKLLVGISPVELALFRFIGVLLPSLPIVLYRNENVFPEGRRLILLLRCFVGTSGLLLTFYAFKNMPLGDSSVIIFSTPVFVAIFSKVFLGEPCGLFSIFTIILSLIGVTCIVKPPFIFGDEVIENGDVPTTTSFLGPLAAVSATVFGANAMIIIRTLRDLHHSVIMSNFGFFACIYTLLILFIFGGLCMPECGKDRLLIVALAIFSFGGQTLLTLSLKIEEAGPISIARSTTIVFAFIWQIIFFKQIPCGYSIIGALLIIVSVFLNGLKKFALSKEAFISRRILKILKS